MANDEKQMNREWSFNVNLSGIAAPTGLGKDTQVPEGFYRAKVTDMYENPEKPGRIIIKCQISEGPFNGVIRTTGLGVPKSEADNVRYYWRALAESAGYTPAELDAGSLTLGPTAFINRGVHLRYKPKDEAAGRQFEEVTFLAPADWQQQKTGFEMRANGGSNATAGEVNVTTQSLGSKPAASTTSTVSKGDVLKTLGIQA